MGVSGPFSARARCSIRSASWTMPLAPRIARVAMYRDILGLLARRGAWIRVIVALRWPHPVRAASPGGPPGRDGPPYPPLRGEGRSRPKARGGDGEGGFPGGWGARKLPPTSLDSLPLARIPEMRDPEKPGGGGQGVGAKGRL